MTRKTMLGIGIVLLGMCPLQMQAQSTLLKQVLLTINSEDGVYAKGDTIKIYGQLTEPLDKPLTMTIYEDGKRMYLTKSIIQIFMTLGQSMRMGVNVGYFFPSVFIVWMNH